MNLKIPRTSLDEAWAAWNLLKDIGPITADPIFGPEDEAVEAVQEMLDRHIDAIELRYTLVSKVDSEK